MPDRADKSLTLATGGDVARHVGAGRLIEGSLVGTPEHLTLTATLRPTVDGSELARASVEGPSDSLPSMVDRLAVRLLVLSAGRDSIRLSKLRPALPALRLYLAGRAAFRAGRLSPAGKLLQQATELDSTFPLAALELVHVSRWSGDGNGVERAKRLALAGRGELDAADQTLLDNWTGPMVTAPERIDQWRGATVTHPDRPETWYELGDAYYHLGLSAGLANPFQLAEETFQRGWALDSATSGDTLTVSRHPVVPEPIKHMVEIAQMRHDTAAVLRLVAAALAADSTSKQGWYLRWHRAVALGTRAERAFWADSQAVHGEAFGQIFAFIEFAGVAVQDYARAANLDIRQWEASGGAAGASFERGVVALDAGRPQESSRFLAEIEKAGIGVGEGRPQGWRLGEAGPPGFIHLALYWGADTMRAAEAARQLVSSAGGVALSGDTARDQLEARCVRWPPGALPGVISRTLPPRRGVSVRPGSAASMASTRQRSAVSRDCVRPCSTPRGRRHSTCPTRGRNWRKPTWPAGPSSCCFPRWARISW